jgi:predicted aspartyl protease
MKVALVLLLYLAISAPAYAMKIGDYRDGQWVECDTANPNGCQQNTSLTTEIPLERRGVGVYELPVRINGVLTLKFILDTGAAEVNIPANIALTLLQTGAITQSDFLPGGSYKLADGSILKSSRFNIRELDMDGIKIVQVPASIGPANGLLLLGQSFLGRLESWSLDNKRHLLIIGGTVQPR